MVLHINTPVFFVKKLKLKGHKNRLKMPLYTRSISPSYSLAEDKDSFSVKQRVRNPKHLISNLDSQREEFKSLVKKEDVPLDSKSREYDQTRYGYTEILENPDAYEKEKTRLKMNLNDTCRLQHGFDLMRALPVEGFKFKEGKAPLFSSEEEKFFWFENYFLKTLEPDQAKELENAVLFNLDEFEGLYLLPKGKSIGKESNCVEKEVKCLISPGFDPITRYYSTTTHYEGISWFVAVAIYASVLMVMIFRKK